MKTKFLFCALFSLFAFSACNNKQPYEVDFDYTISCNEVFTIELQSCSSCGFYWEWENSNSNICRYCSDVDDLVLIHKGAPEIAKWTFEGIQKGHCTLCFKYIDARDKSVLDTKTFEILVN